MQLARFIPGIVVGALCFASDANAQFSAQINSSRWTPNHNNTQHANSGYGYSDGSSENAIGLTNGGEVAWFQGFTPTAAA